MKRSLAELAILLAVGVAASAQATPTASSGTPRYNPGPSIPLIDGNLQYALTGSEIIQTGLNSQSGVYSTTNISGDVEYLTTSAVHPFTLLYAGGVLFSTNNVQGTTNFYQTFSASQGLVGRGWAVGISDSMQFLPQSPTTGLSGIPGVGDLGLQPIPDPSLPGQYVLTDYERRILNNVGGNVERQLTGRTSIVGSGSYGIMRFLGNDPQGLNSDQIGGQVGFHHLLNRRSSMGANFQYSSFTYTSNPTAFHTYGFNLQYQRQLTKTISLDASAGPQWVSAFEALPSTTSGLPTAGVSVPSRLGVQTNVGLTLARKLTSFAMYYTHGVNSGSGVQTGATSDGFSASASRAYGRMWATSASLSYSRTSGLVDNNVSSAVFGGLQVNRRLTNTLSAFGSYTAIHQNANSTLIAHNAFSGFSQSFSIGITFAPRMTRLGQF